MASNQQTDRPTLIVRKGHQERVNALGFSPDGLRPACGSFRKITMWDTSVWKTVQVLEEHTAVFTGLSFSRDKPFLASGAKDKTTAV